MLALLAPPEPPALAGRARRRSPTRGRGHRRLPAAATALSAAQLRYLALAESGVARAKQRFRDARRHWYDSRLGDRERYPLATIWDIVPLFESLDAIAIAQPTAHNLAAVRSFAAGAERYLNHGLRPLAGYSPYPGDREARHRDLVRRQRLVGARVRERLSRDRVAALPARRRTGAALHRRRRVGPARAAGSGGTRTTPTRPARRSPPAPCWRRSCTPTRTRASPSRRPRSSSPGPTRRASARPTGCTPPATSTRPRSTTSRVR